MHHDHESLPPLLSYSILRLPSRKDIFPPSNRLITFEIDYLKATWNTINLGHLAPRDWLSSLSLLNLNKLWLIFAAWLRSRWPAFVAFIICVHHPAIDFSVYLSKSSKHALASLIHPSCVDSLNRGTSLLSVRPTHASNETGPRRMAHLFFFWTMQSAFCSRNVHDWTRKPATGKAHQ